MRNGSNSSTNSSGNLTRPEALTMGVNESMRGATAAIPTTSKIVTLVEAVNMALHRAMENDPDVVVLGEDIGTNGGVFAQPSA